MPGRHRIVITVLAVLPSSVGCQHRSAAPISEGIVTLDGRPLANVVVCLVPVDEAALPIDATVADDAGRFRLRSIRTGRYTAVVSHTDPLDTVSPVPKRYLNPRTSPLVVVLPLENPLTLTLERE